MKKEIIILCLCLLVLILPVNAGVMDTVTPNYYFYLGGLGNPANTTILHNSDSTILNWNQSITWNYKTGSGSGTMYITPIFANGNLMPTCQLTYNSAGVVTYSYNQIDTSSCNMGDFHFTSQPSVNIRYIAVGNVMNGTAFWNVSQTYISPVTNLPSVNVTFNTRNYLYPNTILPNTFVSLQQLSGSANGFTDANGNITFNVNTSATPMTVLSQKTLFDSYLGNITLDGSVNNVLSQIYLHPSGNGNIRYMYNIKTGDTGQDVTNQISINEYYNGTWNNDTPTYYTTAQQIANLGNSYFTYNPSDNSLSNLPTLSDYLPNQADANSIIEISYTGYLPYTIHPFIGYSFNHITLTPIASLPQNGKCSKVFNVIDETPSPIKIIINRFESGFSEIIDMQNGYAEALNNNYGNYTFAAYNPNDGTQYNKGSFLCEGGTNATGKTVQGVHRESIYNPAVHNINQTVPSLPSHNVYVELTDANTGASIYPYTVSIVDELGKFYNFTVSANLGKLTPHAYISDDRTIGVSIAKTGYVSQTGYYVLNGYPLDYNNDHIIKMSANKINADATNYTIWTITVKDGINYNPVSNAVITIYSGMNIFAVSNTNNAGIMVVNLTHPTGIGYDVVAHKDGYGDGQTMGIQTPSGAYYYSNITMYPIFTVITTSPLMIGNWTPNLNQSNWSAPQSGACRLSLDMDSETFWSPILNIEACVGITTPIYQVYILAVLVDIICGILIARKYKSKESFVVGAVIGNTLCAVSGLIAWIVWIVVIIPLALLFMYKGGK